MIYKHGDCYYLRLKDSIGGKVYSFRLDDPRSPSNVVIASRDWSEDSHTVILSTEDFVNAVIEVDKEVNGE